MRNWWRTWSYEIPLAISDALWDVLVVQFAAFLDRLTLRRVLEFVAIAVLVMAFAQTFPIDLAILFAGDTLMYLEIVVAIRLAAGRRAHRHDGKSDRAAGAAPVTMQRSASRFPDRADGANAAAPCGSQGAACPVVRMTIPLLHGECSRPRDPNHLICRPSKTRLIQQIETMDRSFDLTAREPDIAQCPIVQLMQGLHRGPAIPIGGDGTHPRSDPAHKSPNTPDVAGRIAVEDVKLVAVIVVLLILARGKPCRWRERWLAASAPSAASDCSRSPQCNRGLMKT